MSNVAISKNDLLATIAHYRASVEGQQGTATPYPEKRAAELTQIDSFAKSVQNHAGSSLQEMSATEHAKANVAAKTCNLYVKAQYVGLAALGVGMIPAVQAFAGPAALLVGAAGGIGMLVASMAARLKSAEYYAASNLADQLDNYGAYAEAQIAQNPPGVGPIPQPAICPMPPQVAAQPPGQGNNEPAVCAQPPA